MKNLLKSISSKYLDFHKQKFLEGMAKLFWGVVHTICTCKHIHYITIKKYWDLNMNKYFQGIYLNFFSKHLPFLFHFLI